VFRASTSGGTELYRGATTFKFVAHKGSVYGCDCSPFHRNLFASCGMDGHLRIGSFLQHSPVVTLEQGVSSCYLYDVKWSPTRPTVLAAATGTGSTLVFDLGGDVDSPVELPAGGPSGNAVLALAFNASVRGVLATGDAAGVVRVFKLGWFHSNRQKKDAAVLRGLEANGACA
jgi:WD40 repeat protein